LLVSTNITGDTLYTSSYGHAGSASFLRSIIRTLDNGYLIGGYTGSSGTYSQNALLVKLDGQGTNGNLPSVSSKFTTTISATTVSFKDISAGAIKWNWDFSDGKVSTVQNPTHTFAVAGNYTVCLTTSNYCDTASYCEVISVKKVTTQVSENGGRVSALGFFPQPCKDQVTFKLTEAVLIPSFRVYDLAGRAIGIQVQVSVGRTENEYVIDVSGLQDGVYIFESEFTSGLKCRSKVILNR
jgi:PKD repeat protein